MCYQEDLTSRQKMFTERRKKWIQEKRSVCIIDKLWNLERLKAQIKDEEIGFIFACHKILLENVGFLRKHSFFTKRIVISKMKIEKWRKVSCW